MDRGWGKWKVERVTGSRRGKKLLQGCKIKQTKKQLINKKTNKQYNSQFNEDNYPTDSVTVRQ